MNSWAQREVGRSKMAKPQGNLHQVYLDSANTYKQSDIEKSIDYITNSIAVLGKRADKKSLSESLVALGEVYRYHNQYDLAITNYIDALEAYKSTRITLLLAEAYILNKQFSEAEKELQPLLKIEGLKPFQKVRLNENLGDAYRGLGLAEKAVAFYEEGLVVAKKNQITPKLADLNSKIADTYAQDDKLVEAGEYYNSSLQLTEGLEPKRAVQEKEKVADFYNQKNQYGAEIELRKKKS
ncbi:tetratricopeptide repeat protein [Zobellia nedashkovskayae]